jgi:hypothetical protein
MQVQGEKMRKLPVIGAVKHIAETVIDNIDVAFKISWPWMLVLLGAGFVAAFFAPHIAPGTIPTAGTGAFAGIAFLMSIVTFVAFASIAINWHRYVLLNEITTGAGLLRFDGLVARYVGNSLLAALILVIPFSIFFAIFFAVFGHSLGGPSDVFPILPIIAISIAFLIASPFMYRLFIKLPAIALGRTDYGFGQAMRDSQGNFLEMMGFILLFTIAMLVPSFILGFITGILEAGLGIIGTIVSVVLNVAYQWFTLIIGISALTTLYGFFVEKRDF